MSEPQGIPGLPARRLDPIGKLRFMMDRLSVLLDMTDEGDPAREYLEDARNFWSERLWILDRGACIEGAVCPKCFVKIRAEVLEDDENIAVRDAEAHALSDAGTLRYNHDTGHFVCDHGHVLGDGT